MLCIRFCYSMLIGHGKDIVLFFHLDEQKDRCRGLSGTLSYRHENVISLVAGLECHTRLILAKQTLRLFSARIVVDNC